MKLLAILGSMFLGLIGATGAWSAGGCQTGFSSGTCTVTSDGTTPSCARDDVNTAVGQVSNGDTVVLASAACTWTSGVAVAKAITIQGGGSGRIVAYSLDTLALTTGEKTITVYGTNIEASGGAPVRGAVALSNGQAIRIIELGTPTNYLIGTVTSYSAGTLVANISSTGGTIGEDYTAGNLSNGKRWLIATTASTTITNNANIDTGLLAITESTAGSIRVTGIKFASGSHHSHYIVVAYASGGKPVIVDNCYFQEDTSAIATASGNGTPLMFNTNRGLVYSTSHEAYPATTFTGGGIGIQDDSNNFNAWGSIAKWGADDTTGDYKVYVESSDFHGYRNSVSTDNNGRAVVRYSFFNNGGILGTHGADTSNWGQRYIEAYYNYAVWSGYSTWKTFNSQNYVYLRGGSLVLYNNVLPDITSGDYGDKPEVVMTVMNLQRSSGPNPCWGANNAGDQYPAPRQVGMGYVTGASGSDSVGYVGDSEPVYIWDNSRTPVVSLSDYGGAECTNPDSSSGYIVSTRDYFNNGTAKTGWNAYTYPHPLRGATTATHRGVSVGGGVWR